MEPHRPLADVIRTDAALTGTKVACGEGTCGSCTVLVDGRAVLSCLTLAVACDGADVRTVEGDGELLDRLRADVHGRGRVPVRLLHPRPAALGRRAPARHPAPERGRDPGRDEREPVPLRRLPGHRARRRAGGGGGLTWPGSCARRSRWRAATRSAGRSSRTTPRPSTRTASALAVVGHPHARVSAAARVSGRGPLHLGHQPAGDGARRRPAQPARQRPRRRRSTSPPRAALPGVRARDRPGRRARPRRPAGADRRPGLRGRRGRRGRRRHAATRPSGRSRRSRPRGSRSRSSSTSTRASPARSSPRSRPRRPAATSTRPSRPPRQWSSAEYRTPAQVQNPLEPHCAVADWEAGEPDRVVVDAGHLRRPRRARRGVRPRARRRARRVRVHGRRLRRQAGRRAGGVRWRPSSPAAAAGRCGSCYSRREETHRRRPPRRRRCRPTASARTPTASCVGIESSAVIGVGLHGWVVPRAEPGGDAVRVRERALDGAAR